MSLTREKAIIEACAIVSLAYRSIGDYSHASDGFCVRCEATQERIQPFTYSNNGKALEYVRLATPRQLKRDGYVINKNFSSVTGKEI